MSDQPDDLQDRLKALEDSTIDKKPRRGRSMALPVIAATSVFGLLAVFYTLQQPAPEEALATATPEEFQNDGSNFGSLAPPDKTTPAPEIIVNTGPSEAEVALREQLATLKAQLEALQNQCPQTIVDESAGKALAALTAQFEAMRADQKAERERFDKALREKDRDLERLKNELEMARLSQPDVLPNTFPEDNSDEEARLKDLERRRAEEEAARLARIASPILALGGSANGANSETAVDKAKISDNEAFVFNGARPSEVTRARVIANPEHVIPQGTTIQAVTETSLDSSLPGAIRAVVTEDVHSFDGSRILIPRGAKLIGRYKSNLDLAQKRVMIAWDRIILPSNQTIEISAYSGDELGRSGTAGSVDTKFGTRFMSAALISLIGAAPAVAANNAGEGPAADALNNIGTDLRDSTQDVIGEYLSIGPVIHVDPGTRITVMVDRDLEIY
ncbi:MAG: TrbI/VirB10 family protein [Deltaproteobacteria bacterium]